MAVPLLRQRPLRIYRQTSTPLQLKLGTQIDPVSPEHIGTREGQTTNMEAKERGVPDTISQLLHG